ncbi:MAG TPA: short-chain fatty acid transporter [Flavobacteriaceae bacterium]|jgi:short-chain fatty acids transporter|nr:short-chain fatty acid transporter [Flavobacteriaceae bacterium]HIN97741.1 short-chain fatty acid transporter [Flavobacteriaceae bacterium]|tara:strand:+ start:2648 stop:4045 length:1398 start_codon:yes stop_codon:yes gene_type:complete
MLAKFGETSTRLFEKYMPNAFVFAMLLTIITGLIAFVWLGAKPMEIVTGWYDGFYSLLEFGMQIVLIIITGFAIALSPLVNNGIDKLTNYLKTPRQVYVIVVLAGTLLSLISFGWIVITCVLARELAIRIKGVNYPFLVACVYFSGGSWVSGLSSSIPLLLGTENNYLIEAGILTEIIPSAFTLGSTLNIAMMLLYVVCAPLMLFILIPKTKSIKQLDDMLVDKTAKNEPSIQDEAYSLNLSYKSVSDTLNNGIVLQICIVLMGLSYIIYHFYTNGFQLNFNIMIFIFLIVGLALHKTPMRYVIAMKRSSSNVSGILYQYPFYAGIMGIMLYTGLGEKLAEIIASVATIETYPFFAYVTGGVMNFAIPSAGGEFAVVGPSIINAVKEIGEGLPANEVSAMISRASLSIAYGESLSNVLQPFYLLLVFPIMGSGIKIQARDVMGYLVLPFIIFFVIQSILVMWIPL